MSFNIIDFIYLMTDKLSVLAWFLGIWAVY